MKSRILKKGKIFKIGEISFKVTGLSPSNKGVITSKTFIHCNNYYSTSTVIKRCLLLTTQKYDNFNQEVLIKEILSCDSKPIVLNKSEVVQVKHYEFYVRNCEPETGILNNESVIKIENKEMQNINKIKIAVIKNNVPQFQTPVERRNYEDYIYKEYFSPYFLSGIKKYIERGDILNIEDLEIFILNSTPEQGFITQDTHVIFKFGLTRERCLEKINAADNKYAISLLALDETLQLGSDLFSDIGMNSRLSRFMPRGRLNCINLIKLVNHSSNVTLDGIFFTGERFSDLKNQENIRL
jgi:hypothetical protein